MRDLFVGSLGRLNNHDGSRMFTTPNTIHVPPDYEIETDVPNVAEFVTCSLDGRLWAFRRSRRYYVAALSFDELDNELAFAYTSVLSNANIIGRGIDWLLTDNAIVQAVDDEPYINTANLFSDNQTSFLYSALRSKDVTSAWGASEDTGNSDGYGYFNRSALLQSVSKHYSLLPAVGDWHIIKNFLVRNPDNPLADSHNSMLNIRPLIPLEFHGSTPAYGCGFDNDIFITHFNGELWARGLYHIGRCYILPAVFDEQGNPQEFYLYISPDYKKTSTVTQADWLNLGILKTSDNIYGFLTSQADSLNNGLCFKSDNPKIFDTSANQWQELSQSGAMFIDTLNHSGLVLHDDGAIFLNGNSYECKGLSQWLAPAGVVEAVTPQSVISSFDNTAIATYIQQGFYREALTGKKLPLSVSASSGKKFSLGVADAQNVKSVQVNSIAGTNNAEAIAWENVYKNAVEIKFLNSFFLKEEVYFSTYYPITVIEKKGHTTLATDDLWWSGIPPTEEYDDTSSSPLALSMNMTMKIMWINPENGNPEYSTVVTSVRNNIPIDNRWWSTNGETGEQVFENYDPWYYAWGAYGTNVKTDPVFGYKNNPLYDYQNNEIGFWYKHYTYNSIHSDEPYSEGYTREFVSCGNIPNSIEGWVGNVLFPNNELYFDGFITPHNTQNSGVIACFKEENSNTKFLCHIKANFNPQDMIFCYYNRYINNSYNEELHIITLYDSSSNRFLVLVFKSKLHPDIFDFKSETQRS